MPRKRAKVEIGVIAGMLGAAIAALVGCVDGPDARSKPTGPAPVMNPVPKFGTGTPPPDGLDYLRAVQCGGLMWALQSVSDEWIDKSLGSVTGLYREWAELRAREAGQEVRLALRDMAASRDDIIADAGAGTNDQIAKSIMGEYPGDIASCRSAARAADYDIVIVGG